VDGLLSERRGTRSGLLPSQEPGAQIARTCRSYFKDYMLRVQSSLSLGPTSTSLLIDRRTAAQTEDSSKDPKT
jgi:hypothetical protein